ncbi:MAG: multicopper oxidase family protein [Acidimicrobiia bacterium]
MPAPRHLRLAVPVALAAVVVALTGCDSGSSAAKKPGRHAPTTTTTVADPSHLGHSTTTVAAGGIVPTSFPTTQGQPLAEPPVIRSVGGFLRTTFDVHEATYEVAGQAVRGKTYGPGLLGPTLVVNPGDHIEIALQNHLAEVTNFHTHGLHTSPIGISDNVLRTMPAESNDAVSIDVPTDVAPGTYWYHAHLHGLTEEQVFSGLAGTLIVNGLTPRLPASLQSVPEHLISLRDVQLDGNAIITKNINSDAPMTRTVNGQVNPVITAAPGETMLLRLGDMSADIWYRLKLDGARFTVLAEDANPLGRVEQHDELLLPPGKRFDVLVRWPRAGRYHLRTLAYSTGPAGDSYPARVLATFAVSGPGVASPPLPTSMGALPDLEHDPIAVHRKVVFSENDKGFYINGRKFDPNHVAFTPKLGTTEEWTIHNVTKEQHPFHIHVNDFQIMSIDGKRVHSSSLRDTVPLPVGGTVVIRMRFTQFTGRYVFHCHILAHEDGGMMAIVDVTPDGKPAPPDPSQVPTAMPGT